jgi:hypothetical protein
MLSKIASINGIAYRIFTFSFKSYQDDFNKIDSEEKRDV